MARFIDGDMFSCRRYAAMIRYYFATPRRPRHLIAAMPLRHTPLFSLRLCRYATRCHCCYCYFDFMTAAARAPRAIARVARQALPAVADHYVDAGMASGTMLARRIRVIKRSATIVDTPRHYAMALLRWLTYGYADMMRGDMPAR